MSAALGIAFIGLALCGLVDIVRRVARSVWALGLALDAVAVRLGAWWRKKALAVAKVEDFRSNGLIRLQAEVIAMQATQIVEMRASQKETLCDHN